MRLLIVPPRARALALALACAASHACGLTDGAGPSDAGDARSGRLSYVPPDRGYRLWYLAPPWEPVEMTAERALFRVPAAPNMWVPAGVPNALVALTVERVAGTTPEAAVRARLEAWRARYPQYVRVLYPPRPVRFAGGAMGVEVAWVDSVGFDRVAAVQLPDGRTAVLAFRGSASIANDSDVTGMIGEFEPRPVAP